MKKFIFMLCAFLATTAMAFADNPQQVDCGGQVTITATPSTGYHFVRWSDNTKVNPYAINNVTSNIDLTAYFAKDRFEIVFKNWDGTELQKDSVDYGDAVTYNGDIPTKSATAQYTFTFAAWNPTIVSPAVANATYTAKFDTTVNKYMITFQNYDGTTLQSTEWDYGTTPTYNGAIPTKPATAEKTFTFSGWSPSPIASVTGAATYTAQFSNQTNSYTITVDGENGTTTGGGTFQYGTEITITATPNSCYSFVQWNDGDKNASRSITVTGDATYTATFEIIKYNVSASVDPTAGGSVTISVP